MARKSVRDVLRLDTVDLAALDPAGRPIGPKSKKAAAEELAATGAELADLQEALYAEDRRSVLLVLQGMDTSGKGGTIRHVVGLVNPQGLHIASFKKPTPAERRHHFLWRVRKLLPELGRIGVFDRSHYEDVLVPKVEGQLSAAAARTRYQEINAFERELAESGVTVLKCFLHISPDVQRERLLARLDDPRKHWKYTPADIDGRSKWSRYQQAYTAALKHCSATPWYAVPADRKWYRNWAVSRLLLETMRELDPKFPPPAYDIEAEKARLLNADPLA
ncbi:polyphosphate kinase 2 family protein [Crossiella sp. CA-258035]|uniref:PPK2 family polyphosphate kinase n=1 Tax=Crossiella sp. CA-258035 TaxID=2981138 RepID=UPI0024BD5BB5|nr:PPK2 family polyphosphate kinase [Crossiella sp. CA-258035]WHT20426.1 polyphosphate kinase 2 family protein [Crossiella sp. CA-258035]